MISKMNMIPQTEEIEIEKHIEFYFEKVERENK